MKRIISISIIIGVLIIVAIIIAVNYGNSSIFGSRPDVIKPSETVTQSNTTGKHYQIGISDGIGVIDKH